MMSSASEPFSLIKIDANFCWNFDIVCHLIWLCTANCCIVGLQMKTSVKTENQLRKQNENWAEFFFKFNLIKHFLGLSLFVFIHTAETTELLKIEKNWSVKLENFFLN